LKNAFALCYKWRQGARWLCIRFILSSPENSLHALGQSIASLLPYLIFAMIWSLHGSPLFRLHYSPGRKSPFAITSCQVPRFHSAASHPGCSVPLHWPEVPASTFKGIAIVLCSDGNFLRIRLVKFLHCETRVAIDILPPKGQRQFATRQVSLEQTP